MRKTSFSALVAPIVAAAAAIALSGCIPMPPTVTAATTQPEVETVADPTPSATPTPSASPTQEPAAAEGSRDQPFPAGTPLTSTEWDVVIGATEIGVEAIVAEANMFNEPPAEGFVYIRVPVSATYTGADSSTTFDISVAYVSASGESFETYDSLIVTDDGNPYQELYTGGSASYYEYLEVSAAEVQQGLVRVETGLFTGAQAFVTLA